MLKKSPGRDGFPIDFYIVFWQKVKGHFMDMLHCVVKENRMHSTAKDGIISLIPRRTEI